MTTTPNLTLTYIVSSQAQKEVTHNGALNDLDFMTQLSVIDYTLATPPASPTTGDAYIIAASPTGAWAGFAGCVAGYYGGWSFKLPLTGWRAWSKKDNRVLYYNGTGWVLLATPKLDVTTTWNPGTIANGATLLSSTLTVTGAAAGDFAMVAAPYDLQGVTATAYVTAANTARIALANSTGASVALASGTWRARIVKA